MNFLDVSSWGPITTLAVGGIAGALVFWIGQALLRRRGEEEEEPTGREYGPEGPDEDPPDDLFVSGPRKKERRASLRRAGNPVPVLVTDAEVSADPISGWVLDRSTGGLCLSVEVEVETGTILNVRTKNAPETIPWSKIEVKNCRKNGREYELGCQWVRTPPWSVLLLFG